METSELRVGDWVIIPERELGREVLGQVTSTTSHFVDSIWVKVKSTNRAYMIEYYTKVTEEEAALWKLSH